MPYQGEVGQDAQDGNIQVVSESFELQLISRGVKVAQEAEQISKSGTARLSFGPVYSAVTGAEIGTFDASTSPYDD